VSCPYYQKLVTKTYDAGKITTRPGQLVEV